MPADPRIYLQDILDALAVIPVNAFAEVFFTPPSTKIQGAVREPPFLKDGRITMRPYKDGGVKHLRERLEN